MCFNVSFYKKKIENIHCATDLTRPLTLIPSFLLWLRLQIRLNSMQNVFSAIKEIIKVISNTYTTKNLRKIDQRNVAAQYAKHESKGKRPFVYLFSAPCTRTLKSQHKNLKKSVIAGDAKRGMMLQRLCNALQRCYVIISRSVTPVDGFQYWK